MPLTSNDLGVAESSSAFLGHSLQLIGLRSDYSDFNRACQAAA